MTASTESTFESCLAAGRQSLRAGRTEEGCAQLKRALELAHDDVQASEALARLAVAYAQQGKYSEAEPMIAEALQRAGKSPAAAARALTQMGVVRWVQGELRTARAFLEQAQAEFKRLGMTADRANALTNLGLVLKGMGQYQRAIDAYSEAVRLSEALGESLAVVVGLNNLGECYLDLGAYEQAESLFRRALDVAAPLDVLAHTVDLQRNLGRVRAECGALEEGAAAIEHALALGREYQRTYLCAQALASLADVRLAEGDVERAQAAAEELLALDPTVPTSRARARLALGRCALAHGEGGMGLLILQEGLLDAQKAMNEMLVLRYHAALSQVVDHPAIAQVHRRIARELAEQFADGLTDKALQATFRASALFRSIG